MVVAYDKLESNKQKLTTILETASEGIGLTDIRGQITYANPELCKMDFANIATHELGHSVGLDDLYDDKCREQTMHGYADYGETKKRTLEAGDIAGISKLY